MVLLNLLTLGLWSKLGRLTHYAFDAVLSMFDSASFPQIPPVCRPLTLRAPARLVSTVLAGMKRSTGLTFKTERAAGENKDVSSWIERYLGVGEWVMDQSVAIAGASGWFERRR
ncbi:hypothetical protein ACRALDRAFT_2027365 [Sodiomyces alcalophilus JCM 7366]|uniref:uncharacterized protein n=1 Tax=Sodiomyces alcalophilus JCM 7366 TaxID=591952 RepID=UPI0039B37F40